ncbi:MAG: tRNA (adenosine(37)-N6)-threonylcarbamoyltransferase complex dimerization subunit type 1 TsaB [Ketobacteraceae bacterium]|nr:tRNA (adenosine(37)-N6)-threonylcarbamoyltransferase complex dimerization subunit type 1 TsaB [Ketobacteraceae bacterium]
MSDWILAIDTSTEACSCALGQGDRVYERYTDIPRKHAEKVLPMVEELLAEAAIERRDLGAIAFGRGPGAFTGLRIAASVVQGLAFALELPVIPVSSLQALAQRGYREYQHNKTVAAIDARMGEIYWCCFCLDSNGLMQPLSEEFLCPPSEMQTRDVTTSSGWHGVGTGWQYQQVMPAPFCELDNVHSGVFTHALDVLALAMPRFHAGEGVAATDALPVYLRNKVTHQKPSG